MSTTCATAKMYAVHLIYRCYVDANENRWYCLRLHCLKMNLADQNWQEYRESVKSLTSADKNSNGNNGNAFNKTDSIAYSCEIPAFSGDDLKNDEKKNEIIYHLIVLIVLIHSYNYYYLRNVSNRHYNKTANTKKNNKNKQMDQNDEKNLDAKGESTH